MVHKRTVHIGARALSTSLTTNGEWNGCLETARWELNKAPFVQPAWQASYGELPRQRPERLVANLVRETHIAADRHCEFAAVHVHAGQRVAAKDLLIELKAGAMRSRGLELCEMSASSDAGNDPFANQVPS